MSIVLGWTEFKTYVEQVGPERGRPERPSECPFCDGARVWFDGWRWVFCVVLRDGTPHRFDEGLPLQRVVCATCDVSWVLRPAFLYPHRSFQPDLVERAGLAYLDSPAATYEVTAKEHGCSPCSVWRWVGWLATLVQPPALLAEVEVVSGASQSAGLIPREVPQDHDKAHSPERERTLLGAYQGLCAIAVGRAPSRRRPWTRARCDSGWSSASGRSARFAGSPLIHPRRWKGGPPDPRLRRGHDRRD